MPEYHIYHSTGLLPVSILAATSHLSVLSKGDTEDSADEARGQASVVAHEAVLFAVRRKPVDQSEVSIAAECDQSEVSIVTRAESIAASGPMAAHL